MNVPIPRSLSRLRHPQYPTLEYMMSDNTPLKGATAFGQMSSREKNPVPTAEERIALLFVINLFLDELLTPCAGVLSVQRESFAVL